MGTYTYEGYMCVCVRLFELVTHTGLTISNDNFVIR